MARPANGRAPFPGLFVAYPSARRNWRAGAALPHMPDPPARPDIDPAEYDGLIDYPGELPDVDETVRAFGRGAPWPGEESATAAVAPSSPPMMETGKDPVYGDAGPRLAPRAQADVDPALWSAAAGVRDLIAKQADADAREYGATLYRGRDGKIRATPLITGEAAQLDRMPSVPEGATVLGYVHNHPLKTAQQMAAHAHYDEAQTAAYLAREAAEPSASDMGTMKSWYSDRRVKTAPSALVFLSGPDGQFWAFDPKFIGHPDEEADAAYNRSLAKPFAP